LQETMAGCAIPRKRHAAINATPLFAGIWV